MSSESFSISFQIMFDLWETPLPVLKFLWKTHQFYVTVLLLLKWWHFLLTSAYLPFAKQCFSLGITGLFTLCFPPCLLWSMLLSISYSKTGLRVPSLQKDWLLALFLLDDPSLSGMLWNIVYTDLWHMLKCLQESFQWLISSQNISAQKSILVVSVYL